VAATPAEPYPELPEPSRIGERLRAERQRRGMTVREIARRVGVSPSLISQIERDKVNPSVGTLWGIVTVLGLHMGDLYGDVPAPSTDGPAPAGPVTAPGHRLGINLETGVRWERLTTTSDSLTEFLSVVYPPGAASCGE